jgi:hypothetical protein
MDNIDNEAPPFYDIGDVVKIKDSYASVTNVADGRRNGHGVSYAVQTIKGTLTKSAWFDQKELQLVIPVREMLEDILAREADTATRSH